MHLTFVESLVFTSRWHKRLDDEALRRLQQELMDDPSGGERIPGCPFLRKVRVPDATRGKGKRSGLRVIYMHTPAARRIDLLTVYGKDEASDLTPDELKAWCDLARQLREALSKNERGS